MPTAQARYAARTRRRAKLLEDLYDIFKAHADVLIPVVTDEEREVLKTVEGEFQ